MAGMSFCGIFAPPRAPSITPAAANDAPGDRLELAPDDVGDGELVAAEVVGRGLVVPEEGLPVALVGLVLRPHPGPHTLLCSIAVPTPCRHVAYPATRPPT